MKRFEAYTKAMREQDITQGDIAETIHRATAYISQRFNGKGSFLQSECYAMMKLANLPLEDIYYYFPPDGISVERIERKEESDEMVLVNRERLRIVKEIFDQVI